MDESFALLYWHWLALGVALVIFEMLVPGAAMLWVGAAAIATGIISWLLVDLDWQTQFFIFGVLGITAVIFSRRYLKLKKTHSEDPLINHRYERLIGHVMHLATPIADGHGRVAVDDGSCLVTGPDLPAGSKVRVVAVDGAVLVVEAVI